MGAEDFGPLGACPGHKLVGQPRFANAGFSQQQHHLRLARLRQFEAFYDLAEGGGSSDERSLQLPGRSARAGNRTTWTSEAGLNALGQRLSLGGRLEVQFISQARA